jgi:hypothetical protein
MCNLGERFGKTVLNEFYHAAFRKKLYRSLDELQAELDAWVRECEATARTLVLGQNADANFPRCDAHPEGKDDPCLRTSETEPDCSGSIICQTESQLIKINQLRVVA